MEWSPRQFECSIKITLNSYLADVLNLYRVFCNTSVSTSITWLMVSNTWSPTSDDVMFVLTTFWRMFAVIEMSFSCKSEDLVVIFLTSFITLTALVSVTGTWKIDRWIAYINNYTIFVLFRALEKIKLRQAPSRGSSRRKIMHCIKSLRRKRQKRFSLSWTEPLTLFSFSNARVIWEPSLLFSVKNKNKQMIIWDKNQTTKNWTGYT